MERLRHRLMPLYSYDPEEDNADWEAELIEDDREQQRALTAIVSSFVRNLCHLKTCLSYLHSLALINFWLAKNPQFCSVFFNQGLK